MPIVDMRDMLNHAYHNNYAIGGFGLVSIDFLQAIILAAESCRSPAILNLPASLFEHYNFELIMPSVEQAAHRAKVPIAIHFDHGKNYESIVRAINLGCNSVMIDASLETFPNNVAQTKQISLMAHACGIAVEGALGYVGGGEGENANCHPGKGIYTLAEEVRAYVERTDVDSLAVSIGTSHGRQHDRVKLDFKRLKRINDMSGIPLVLHGGSGLVEEQYHKLILNGVAKINFYTELSDIAGKAISSNVQTGNSKGYLETMQSVKACLIEQIKLHMHLWGSAGRAAEVLMQCRPWQIVEHIVLCDTNDQDKHRIDTLLEEGHQILGSIPGVRDVYSGWAVAEPPRYRFCWLVRLTHINVIENYLQHENYIEYINQFLHSANNEKINIFVSQPSRIIQNSIENSYFYHPKHTLKDATCYENFLDKSKQ